MEREGAHFEPHIPSSRLGRLLREREKRKHYRSSSLRRESRTGDSGHSGACSQTEESLESDSEAKNCSDQSGTRTVCSEKQRLLVVANRLPLSATKEDDGTWKLEVGVGGLATALFDLKEFDARWIGWAGMNMPDEAAQEELTKALAEKCCIPVFLDEEIFNLYYNGYCNNILWPLFHYLGLPEEDCLTTTQSSQSQFNAYKRVNQMFADVVSKHYKKGDIVWCHDYHLMYLPKCLKGYDNNIKVGWFLHTPFPSSEIHRTLPSRSELLMSVLQADIVGFHTYDYARHFVSSCTRILGLESTPDGVEHQGKLTRVVAYPVGIDFERFVCAIDVPEVQDHIVYLKQCFAGRKVILGVDRLDMIKGIPQKLLAFERFLEKNINWRDKVVLIQIAVPSRTDVPKYQRLASQVHEIVGRINGRFGTLTSLPVHHLDCSLDFHALCSLYAITDVALVTSLRDGMNLVSYEFVACQASKKGVLILSEFAGAAQSLGAGAILVNPWNILEVCNAISHALNMPTDEREKRHRYNYNYVMSHTSQEWAAMFVSELNDTVVEAQCQITQIQPCLPAELVIRKFIQSDYRLLIFGFNATLTQSVETPGERVDQIKDLELKLHPEIKEPLRRLCNEPKTTVLIVSGSTRIVLDDNFDELDLWLAAENGMFVRHTSGSWVTALPDSSNMEWVQSVEQVFEYFTDRTPGSIFEFRDTSLVWNYKYADVEFGRLQAKDLLQHLVSGSISSSVLDVYQGSHTVEVRATGLTKGAAMKRILGHIIHTTGLKSPIDYVLCIGHFLGKDEDIYSFFEPEHQSSSANFRRGSRSPSLTRARYAASSEETVIVQDHPGDEVRMLALEAERGSYFSCSVGRQHSSARYVLESSDEVLSLVKELAGQLV